MGDDPKGCLEYSGSIPGAKPPDQGQGTVRDLVEQDTDEVAEQVPEVTGTVGKARSWAAVIGGAGGSWCQCRCRRPARVPRLVGGRLSMPNSLMR